MQTIRYPFLERPSQILRELRQRAPLVEVTLWNGRRAWLVTRHADALRALTDPCLSADATDPNFPSLNPSQVVPNHRASLSRMHEVRHSALRHMVASRFTVRAAQQWRQVSERIVAEQLAELQRDGPPADLISTLALPVPLRLICRLLGVPERDEEYVRRHAQRVTTRAYESSQPAYQELTDFLDELVRRSETDPGDDLIGYLVSERLRPGAITRQELVDMVFLILVAGQTATGSMIGLSALSLLEDPVRYRALREDPALVVPMVEEFLRFQTITSDGVPRVAKRDLVLGGVTVRAGDAVVVSLTSADLDEAVFADPEVLQLRRAGAHRHIAFSWGPHRCLGQHLARMELQVALTALARTIPTLRLAVPVEQVRYGQRDRHMNNLQELPVTW